MYMYTYMYMYMYMHMYMYMYMYMYVSIYPSYLSILSYPVLSYPFLSSYPILSYLIYYLLIIQSIYLCACKQIYIYIYYIYTDIYICIYIYIYCVASQCLLAGSWCASEGTIQASSLKRSASCAFLAGPPQTLVASVAPAQDKRVAHDLSKPGT